MYDTGITISQIRREIKALKRKYAREIAAAVLSPVVDQIVELWNIALAKKLPKPDPLSCVQKVVKAGFRFQTFKALHGYLEDCRYYNYFPRPRSNHPKGLPSRPQGRTGRRPPRQIRLRERVTSPPRPSM